MLTRIRPLARKWASLPWAGLQSAAQGKERRLSLPIDLAARRGERQRTATLSEKGICCWQADSGRRTTSDRGDYMDCVRVTDPATCPKVGFSSLGRPAVGGPRDRKKAITPHRFGGPAGRTAANSDIERKGDLLLAGRLGAPHHIPFS